MKNGFYKTYPKLTPKMIREVEVKDGLIRLKDSSHWYQISFFFQVNVLIKKD